MYFALLTEYTHTHTHTRARARAPVLNPYSVCYELLTVDKFFVNQIAPTRIVSQFGTLSQCDQVALSLYCFARQAVTSLCHRET
jgi:hypothetical protein